MDADELLSFLTLPGFDKSWESLGFDDCDLVKLQLEIMADPAAGVVIPRSNGLRKVRFARRGSGKSGGVRVCYANIGGHGLVLLGCVYAKGRQANLTAAQIDRLAHIVALIVEELEGRRS